MRFGSAKLEVCRSLLCCAHGWHLDWALSRLGVAAGFLRDFLRLAFAMLEGCRSVLRRRLLPRARGWRLVLGLRKCWLEPFFVGLGATLWSGFFVLLTSFRLYMLCSVGTTTRSKGSWVMQRFVAFGF